MNNRNFYPYYNSPLNIPTTRTYINPLNNRRTPSFQNIIHTTERSVDTINSLIPLYKKVKPVIDQGKTLFSSVTSFFTNQKKNAKTVEKVDAEVVEIIKPANSSATTDNDSFNYRENNTNSKPFFL